jgi:hypothetical protein
MSGRRAVPHIHAETDIAPPIATAVSQATKSSTLSDSNEVKLRFKWYNRTLRSLSLKANLWGEPASNQASVETGGEKDN